VISNRKKETMVKTKCIRDPVEESDGERILVMRYWPHGYSKKSLSLTERLLELAPSAQLLNDWKEKRISWEEYEIRYLEEMSGQRQREKIRELGERAKHGTITLLCFEPEGDPHCHRHLLKGLIESDR
jgi:uncharacterized protein YeaO (DUF488 family)